MDRRDALTALALGALPVAALAQRAEPVRRIAVLMSTFVTVYREQLVALAARHRLPAICWTVDPVRIGA